MTPDIFSLPLFGDVRERGQQQPKIVPREYQQRAIDAALYYFEDKNDLSKALMVLPTGAGKSIVIAEIARRLKEPTIVFQPSKEILEQNYGKLLSYGVRNTGIFSASAGEKRIAHLTYATIGSVMNQMERFRHFKNIIIDECHGTNARGGMYDEFLASIGSKVIGLTATPYRLSRDMFNGSILKFLTRTRPRIFSKVIHYTQIKELLDRGYLAKLEYEELLGFDSERIALNTTGAEFDDKAIQRYYVQVGFNGRLSDTVRDLIGRGRKSILVFTRFVEESRILVDDLNRRKPGTAALVTGKTDMRERTDILTKFRAGKIKVVANAMVLVLGFDFPELDTVVIARPTMSLTLFYQMAGRALRPHPKKEFGLIVDACDNLGRFGKVEDLRLTRPGAFAETWYYEGTGGRQLTNVSLASLRGRNSIVPPNRFGAR